jgi:hypothetical protein
MGVWIYVNVCMYLHAFTHTHSYTHTYTYTQLLNIWSYGALLSSTAVESPASMKLYVRGSLYGCIVATLAALTWWCVFYVNYESFRENGFLVTNTRMDLDL